MQYIFSVLRKDVVAIYAESAEEAFSLIKSDDDVVDYDLIDILEENVDDTRLDVL